MINKENQPEWKTSLLKEVLGATTESCESLLKEFNELQRKIDEEYTLDWFNVAELFNRMGSLKMANRLLINLVLKMVADDQEKDMQLVEQNRL